VVLFGLAGCFDAPSPACSFLCGDGESCPDGYSCATDGVCKRSDVDDDFDCAGAGAAPDAAPPAVAVCGDDSEHPDETCDDGNTATETECPYGTASCTLCNADCTAELSLTGRVCGDDTNDAEETCDDGNTATETECAYGTASCTLCDATCANELALAGRVCGDGTNDPEETCDDNNTDACGVCAANCLSVAGAVASTTITVGNAAADGETVVVGGTTFEYDAASDGTTGIAFGVGIANRNDVAADLAATLSANLAVSANNSGPNVNVTYNIVGAVGNLTVTTTGDFSGEDMAGGTGTACNGGVGCTDNIDCLSAVCNAGTCDPPS
jgi:hypothetical protein